MTHKIPLPDPQSESIALDHIALDWVGMQGITLPVTVDSRPLHGKVDIGVDLLAESESRGIHMSRLYQALESLTSAELTPALISQFLDDIKKSQSGISSDAFIQISGQFLLLKPALISDLSGWENYPVNISASVPRGISQEIKVPYSSTCPCSASLSRQAIQQKWEQDTILGNEVITRDQVSLWLKENASIATPHSQRSWARVKIFLDKSEPIFPIKTLINQVENALGTAVQTAVKRVDEQAFSIANGSHQMFCEDAARRVYQALRYTHKYTAFDIEVIHEESLHSHNAVARVNYKK